MKSFKSFLFSSNLTVKESSVHGMGIFTKEDIFSGKNISLYLSSLSTEHNDYIRTDIARLINHSTTPNCKLESINGDYYIFANRDILEGEELYTNYFDVLQIAQPREILRDSFIRTCPEIKEELLIDTDINFYDEIEKLRQL